MKFLNKSQVEILSKFKSGAFLTTSFFLDTDKSRQSKKEIQVAAKNLLAEGRNQLEALNAAKDKKGSLGRDMDAIQEVCARDASSNSAGLAVYSCAGAGFLEVLSLPEAPRSRVVFDRNPYVRPLTLILDEYHHLIILLFDRRESRWYDLFMNEIRPLHDLRSEIPKKALKGFEGTETRRVERHAEAAVHEHFKKTADKTFEIFKSNGFDGLVLGCAEVLASELTAVLHAYVKERIKGWLQAKPGDPADRILKEAQAFERELKKKEEEAVVKRLVGELEKGGRASAGLKDCLASLGRGEVQSFVVTRSFSAPGKSCPRCKLLYTEAVLKCPACDRKTDPVLDVVDEAIEAALGQDAAVRHVNPPSKLDHYGKIGALLRFKSR